MSSDFVEYIKTVDINSTAESVYYCGQTHPWLVQCLGKVKLGSTDEFKNDIFYIFIPSSGRGVNMEFIVRNKENLEFLKENEIRK